MKVEMANKASTMTRCTEAVHVARKQMRTLKAENEELKRAKENNPNIDRINGRQKVKCLWHENAKCSREDCKFRHPRKVCKNYNQENCELGENCIVANKCKRKNLF